MSRSVSFFLLVLPMGTLDAVSCYNAVCSYVEEINADLASLPVRGTSSKYEVRLVTSRGHSVCGLLCVDYESPVMGMGCGFQRSCGLLVTGYA